MKKILQGFKNRIQDWRVNHKPAYICDPYRARKCDKSACWEMRKGPCKCTVRKAHAKRDLNGQPIIATDDDLVNMEWLDLQMADYLKDHPEHFKDE